MKLRILDIPEEGLQIEARAAADHWIVSLLQSTFQEDYRKESNALLDLFVLKTCDNISLTGVVEADLTPACDRCLENFKRHLAVPLHINLAPYKKMDTEEKGIEEVDENVNFAFYKGEEIDVGELVRETLVLEIPFRYLCSESCKGLCPQCGQNLNINACSCVTTHEDPRFEVLKKLLKS